MKFVDFLIHRQETSLNYSGRERPLMNQHSPLAALEIRALTKRFDRPAVDGLDLTVRTGEFYCLLGPNGAGKTTTLRMVAGLLAPDQGAI